MKLHFIKYAFLATALFRVCSPAATAEPVAWPLDKYDVAWDSSSKDAKGSMPLGNGDIALNVWVEPNGDLLLLVGKSDSFDEFNRLLKLGRIRIKTTPALVQPGLPFSQVLHLAGGNIEIKTNTAVLRVWVDANHPVAQVDIESPQPVTVQTTLEYWRKERREFTGDGGGSEAFSLWGNWPDKKLVNPDTILPSQKGQIAWCHHNVESQWKRNLELTGLASEIAKGEDPVMDRTFGAIVRATGCVTLSGTELQSEKPATNCSIRIFPLTQKAATTDEWLAAAGAKADAIQELPDSKRLAEHQAWWHSFWNRSWIDIEDNHHAESAMLTYPGPLLEPVMHFDGRKR